MIRTTAQAKRKARQLFRFCLVNGNVDRSRVFGVVSVVLKFRQRGHLLLLKEFRRLVTLEVKARTAKIESAAALSNFLQSKVREKVETAYGAGTTTLFEADPVLIGGMRVSIGSDVYDGTVRGKLLALKKSLGVLENGERV